MKYRKNPGTFVAPARTGAALVKIYHRVLRACPGLLILGLFLCLAQRTRAVEGPPPVPTLPALAYGAHERQTLAFWRADGPGAKPLLVIIHGGGWLHGDALEAANTVYRHWLTFMLQNGISVAAINYRYSTQAPLPAPVFDAARAIQFLRSKADELGLDKTRIAATGDSAGGCTALWLATHDDLADPKATDPVARESTRLCGAWVQSAQTTLEPAVIRARVCEDAFKHAMICRAGGFGSNQELEAGYDKAAALYREFSPVNHLDQNDPPMMLSYVGAAEGPRDGIHDTLFGVLFKEKADQVGATCYLSVRKSPGRYLPIPPDTHQFLLSILKPGASSNTAQPVKAKP